MCVCVFYFSCILESKTPFSYLPRVAIYGLSVMDFVTFTLLQMTELLRMLCLTKDPRYLSSFLEEVLDL